MVILDVDMEFQESNPQFLELFNLNELPHSFFDFSANLKTDIIDIDWQKIVSSIQSRKSIFEIDVYYPLPHQQLSLHLEFIPVKEGDDLQGYILTLEEINEVEVNVHTQFSILKNIYENCPVGVVTNRNDKGLKSNQFFQEMLGYTEDELLNMTISEITHPEDIDKNKEAFEALSIGDKKNIKIEKRYIRKDKSICSAISTVSVYKDKKDDSVTFVALIEDITEQKRIRAILKERKNLLKSVINTSHDAVIILDEELCIKDWNRQAEVILGYTKEEVMNQALLELVAPPAVMEKYLQYWKEYLETDSPKLANQKIETRLIRSDQSEFTAEFSVTPLKVTGKTVYSVFIRDITDLQLSQEALKTQLSELDEKNKELERYVASNSQLENFAYVASHDLKEPLRTIGNFVQLLQKRLDSKLDKTDREFIHYIVTGVQNMNNLIEDLLSYSRVNTQEHILEPMNPEDTLFVVSHNLGKKIQETETIIEIQNLPKQIIANKTKLNQLFQNLIANAIKFKKKDINAHIVVSGKEDEKNWTFTLADNGIGIKPEFFDKIFGLFKKLHSKSDYQGSGIGLAVCKKIVEQHGGEIWVESEYGLGTTFHFTIPKVV